MLLLAFLCNFEFSHCFIPCGYVFTLFFPMQLFVWYNGKVVRDCKPHVIGSVLVICVFPSDFVESSCSHTYMFSIASIR